MHEKFSTKTFNVMNVLSDVIFFLSILGLIFYGTIMGDSIKWGLVVPIGLLVLPL
ncbi:hypothetical protein GCM10009001_07350 [Virgibacillus siamensis]|uniref:Uncharacterized protein n=1 Tax=Virgibacillus siamensis TaxID=480071 RepID=A0ABN1FM39_9BACI